MTPWQILGAHPDIAVADLRRRYAALIKTFRPETHPQDFARIRAAYELALPWARQREAERAERAEDAAAEPAPVVVAPVVEPAAPVDAPDLAARFHAFHALAGSAAGMRDEALLPALRELLHARTSARLDDSQALEFALLRWFIEAEEPPLTLLFEAGRAFDWHAQVARLGSWLAPSALRRMEARLAMSRDRVYARHFSGNVALRRLHSPSEPLPLIVARPGALDALAWAQRWQHLSEDADAPSLAAGLEAGMLRRLRGFCTTDVLAGAAVALACPDALSAITAGSVTTGLVLLQRLALQAGLRQPPGSRAHVAASTIRHPLTTSSVALVPGIAGAALLIDAGFPSWRCVAGLLLIAPALLLLLALLWRALAWAEIVVAWPFQWREAVDRLEFDAMLRPRSSLEAKADPPFGHRLGLARRVRAIPAALRLQAREVAARERPPRQQPIALTRLRGGRVKTNGWRMLWFGIWVLFAILRLADVIGHRA